MIFQNQNSSPYKMYWPKAQDSENMVPDNQEAPPLEGRNSIKFGGMWNLKHETISPIFYDLLIKTELKGDTVMDLNNFYNHISMFLNAVTRLRENLQVHQKILRVSIILHAILFLQWFLGPLSTLVSPCALINRDITFTTVWPHAIHATCLSRVIHSYDTTHIRVVHNFTKLNFVLHLWTLLVTDLIEISWCRPPPSTRKTPTLSTRSQPKSAGNQNTRHSTISNMN